LNFLLGISHHRQTSPRRLRSISPANGNGAALAGIRDLIDLLHVYPTMAEALKVVAISWYNNPPRLWCCAE
jgi:hypothetical protein